MAKASGSTRRLSEAEKVANKAKAHGAELQGLAESIASRYGASVTPINYKSPASIERKAKLEGGYDKITDAVRTTIISDRAQLKPLVEELRQRGARVKEQTPDRYNGYSGYISKVRFSDGTVGEIQVNTPKMIYAKETTDVARRLIGAERYAQIQRETGLEGGRGHKLYEKIRVLDEVKDRAQIISLQKESNEYYAHFRG